MRLPTVTPESSSSWGNPRIHSGIWVNGHGICLQFCWVRKPAKVPAPHAWLAEPDLRFEQHPDSAREGWPFSSSAISQGNMSHEPFWKSGPGSKMNESAGRAAGFNRCKHSLLPAGIRSLMRSQNLPQLMHGCSSVVAKAHFLALPMQPLEGCR